MSESEQLLDAAVSELAVVQQKLYSAHLAAVKEGRMWAARACKEEQDRAADFAREIATLASAIASARRAE